DQPVAVRRRELHRLGARQRVQRSLESRAPVLAHHARARPLHPHLHRAGLLAAAARAARQARGPADLSAAMAEQGRYRRRLWVNRWNLAMSLLTMAFGMFFLLWILATLFARGFEAISPALVTQMTPPPGSDGGLANAIFGSFAMVAIATFISTPIGI